jgi:hypothetical protein
MKYIFLFLISASIVACTSTDKPSSVDKTKAMKDTANYTSLQWLDSVEQNIGKINQGQVVEITWRFKNTGKSPLIIANVRPGCGCTGAEGPAKPIEPGKEGVITAKFDSKNYPGPQHKQVYVQSNTHSTNGSSEDVLSFRLDVIPKN